jgi:hypothetical protein
MEVWLQDACKQFVITWDCHYSQVLRVVSVKKLEFQLRQALRTEHAPVILVLIALFHR